MIPSVERGRCYGGHCCDWLLIWLLSWHCVRSALMSIVTGELPSFGQCMLPYFLGGALCNVLENSLPRPPPPPPFSLSLYFLSWYPSLPPPFPSLPSLPPFPPSLPASSSLIQWTCVVPTSHVMRVWGAGILSVVGVLWKTG